MVEVDLLCRLEVEGMATVVEGMATVEKLADGQEKVVQEKVVLGVAAAADGGAQAEGGVQAEGGAQAQAEGGAQVQAEGGGVGERVMGGAGGKAVIGGAGEKARQQDLGGKVTDGAQPVVGARARPQPVAGEKATVGDGEKARLHLEAGAKGPRRLGVGMDGQKVLLEFGLKVEHREAQGRGATTATRILMMVTKIAA
jgi:hypothetical protein